MTLVVEGLSHIYLKGTPLQRVALEDVSVEVHPGECLAVVGVSGSGKSTLARIIAGLVPPSSGRVLLNGANVAALPATHTWKRRLGRLRRAVTGAIVNPSGLFDRRFWSVSRAPARRPVAGSTGHRPVMLAFQNPEDQFFTTTVFEEIGIGLVPPAAQNPRREEAERPGWIERLIGAAAGSSGPPQQIGMANPVIRAAVLQALRLVDLDAETYGRRDPFTLSGGEQRRVALAVLLARKPRVLVMDEPSAGLDEPGRQRLYACLDRVRREQKTAVILVSHDLEEVAAVADRVVVLSGGRVAAVGETETVVQDGAMLTAAGLAPRPLVRLRSALAGHGHVFEGDWSSAEGVSKALTAALGSDTVPGGGTGA